MKLCDLKTDGIQLFLKYLDGNFPPVMHCHMVLLQDIEWLEDFKYHYLIKNEYCCLHCAQKWNWGNASHYNFHFGLKYGMAIWHRAFWEKVAMHFAEKIWTSIFFE